jgi:hypothetical protein
MTIIAPFRNIPVVGERGKKPLSPAFLYSFHNDTAGGTTVVDSFGNSGDLTLNGTLGTAWTAKRGFIRPSTLNALSSTSYGLQAMPVLVPGKAFCVGWLWNWLTTKTTTTEAVIQLGRSAASGYGSVQFGHNSSGILNPILRGVGASAATAGTFGSSSLYLADRDYAGLMHCEVLSNGLRINGFLDGVQVGSTLDLLWTANGGSIPDASHFSDGLTLLSNRSGASSYTQYVGASTSAGTGIANVFAVSMPAPDLNFAQALALEQKNFPRFVGNVLRAA